MTLEHDVVRDKLIVATLALMDEGGLEAVKARTLATAVGASVGTIYNLFGNVDGLVLAANARIYADLQTVGLNSVAGIEADIARDIAEGRLADTARAKVRARLLGLSAVYIAFVAANANRWNAVLAFNRSRGRQAMAGSDNPARLNALIDIIGRVLEAVPACADADRRRKTARGMWSAVHGIVVTNYAGEDEDGARERAAELIDIIVTALVDGLFLA